MKLWGLRLIGERILDKSGLERISLDAQEEAKVAVEFAQSGVAPTVSEISDDVYWETDHATESSKIGRHFFND